MCSPFVFLNLNIKTHIVRTFPINSHATHALSIRFQHVPTQKLHFPYVFKRFPRNTCVSIAFSIGSNAKPAFPFVFHRFPFNKMFSRGSSASSAGFSTQRVSNYSCGDTTPEGTAVIHTNEVQIVLRVLLDHLHYELGENVVSSAGSACRLCDICHLMGTPFGQLEDLRWSPAPVR